jgi:hypothetical protein
MIKVFGNALHRTASCIKIAHGIIGKIQQNVIQILELMIYQCLGKLIADGHTIMEHSHDFRPEHSHDLLIGHRHVTLCDFLVLYHMIGLNIPHRQK